LKWLAKLIYFRRVRRLERIGEASALLAAGRLDEAEARLELGRARRWMEDVALFHFVMGKLRMEKDALEEAERHFHTALGLGLDRPSVKLNLAVLKVRCCDLGAALAILSDVELSDNEDILEQAKVMRELITNMRGDKTLSEVHQRSARFLKKFLDRTSTLDAVMEKDSPESLFSAITSALQTQKLSLKDREDAILLYGSLVAKHLKGQWLWGLEPRDHRIVIGGVLHQPSLDITRILDGNAERLTLPEL